MPMTIAGSAPFDASDTTTITSPAAVLENKQLVVSTNQTGGAPISFALTDAQFERALAIFTPPPRTKPNLWTSKIDTTFIRKVVKITSYLECVQYMRPGGNCFASMLISNHFDNVMIEKFRGAFADLANDEIGDDDGQFTFSIDEWFTNVRGEVPKDLANWNPKKHLPMPLLDMQVDWYGALTEAELQFEGFVELFANCIALEEETDEAMAKRKLGSMTTFGTHPGDRPAMPAPINQQASFEKFKPSQLLGNAGGGASFAGSGKLGGR